MLNTGNSKETTISGIIKFMKDELDSPLDEGQISHLGEWSSHTVCDLIYLQHEDSLTPSPTPEYSELILSCDKFEDWDEDFKNKIVSRKQMIKNLVDNVLDSALFQYNTILNLDFTDVMINTTRSGQSGRDSYYCIRNKEDLETLKIVSRYTNNSSGDDLRLKEGEYHFRFKLNGRYHSVISSNFSYSGMREIEYFNKINYIGSHFTLNLRDYDRGNEPKNSIIRECIEFMSKDK